MCDPVTVGLTVLGGAVAGKAMAPKSGPAASSAAAQPDPAAEQAAVEARAAQAANAKLANDQKRRREQASLLSRGAQATTTGPTFGDTAGASDVTSPLSGMAGTTNRTTAARATQSLLARGAAATGQPTPTAQAPRQQSKGYLA
jgi:hypothetical protein